jgi:hypothetical protein
MDSNSDGRTVNSRTVIGIAFVVAAVLFAIAVGMSLK